jgi:hypothetical protein
MSGCRSCVSEVESTSHNMALFPPNPKVIASQFASTLRPLGAARQACPLALGRVRSRVLQFPWCGLISIRRFTYLFARGGASVTGRAHFFSSWAGLPTLSRASFLALAVTAHKHRALAGAKDRALSPDF